MQIDLYSFIKDYRTLIGLHALRSIRFVVQLLAYGLIAGVLIATTWGLLTASFITWLMEQHLPTSVAIFGGAILSLLCAWLCIRLVRLKSEQWFFRTYQHAITAPSRDYL